MMRRTAAVSARTAISTSAPLSCARRLLATSAGTPAPSLSSAAKREQSGEIPVTLIPGDGVGPEISESLMGVFGALRVPIHWELFERTGNINQNFDLLASLARNQICVKGQLKTDYGDSEHFMNNNLVLRKSLNLYANIVPIKSLPGVKTRHSGIDMVVFRENTEAEYSGLEQEVAPGVVQSLKVVTHHASVRIAEAAFAYAASAGRKCVHAIHKANIQKMSDGLFLESVREVAQKYPQIQYKEMIIDNTCMQLVQNPYQFDVLVTPNLYGNLITNVGCGLVGGPGVLAGANYGIHGEAVFEPGARHVAADIQGAGVANPTGMLLSGVMLLRHVGLSEHADRVEKAINDVYSRGKILTRDVGGLATTKEFTKALINQLQ